MWVKPLHIFHVSVVLWNALVIPIWREQHGIVLYFSKCYNQTHTSLSPTCLAHCSGLSLKDRRLAREETDRIGAVQASYTVF